MLLRRDTRLLPVVGPMSTECECVRAWACRLPLLLLTAEAAEGTAAFAAADTDSRCTSGRDRVWCDAADASCTKSSCYQHGARKVGFPWRERPSLGSNARRGLIGPYLGCHCRSVLWRGVTVVGEVGAERQGG